MHTHRESAAIWEGNGGLMAGDSRYAHSHRESLAKVKGLVESQLGCGPSCPAGGSGDMSSMSAYFRTVFLLRWGSRAMSALVAPSLSILLISSCASRDTVMLPSSFRAALAKVPAWKENIVLAVPLTPGARPFLDQSAQFPMTTALSSR